MKKRKIVSSVVAGVMTVSCAVPEIGGNACSLSVDSVVNADLSDNGLSDKKIM